MDIKLFIQHSPIFHNSFPVSNEIFADKPKKAMRLLETILKTGKLAVNYLFKDIQELLFIADYFAIDWVKEKLEQRCLSYPRKRELLVEIADILRLHNLALELIKHHLDYAKTCGHLIKQLPRAVTYKLEEQELEQLLQLCPNLEEIDLTWTTFKLFRCVFPSSLKILKVGSCPFLTAERVNDALRNCNNLQLVVIDAQLLKGLKLKAAQAALLTPET